MGVIYADVCTKGVTPARNVWTHCWWVLKPIVAD